MKILSSTIQSINWALMIAVRMVTVFDSALCSVLQSDTDDKALEEAGGIRETTLRQSVSAK